MFVLQFLHNYNNGIVVLNLRCPYKIIYKVVVFYNDIVS